LSDKVFHSINPVDNSIVESHHILNPSQIDTILDDSAAAGSWWKNIALQERIQVISRIKAGLEESRNELATRITLEMGKPYAQSLAEIDKCIWLCTYYAEEGAGILTDETTEYDDVRVIKSHQPLGTILGIMPWNFPIWQTLRYAIPSLLIGNAVLLKPAPNVISSSMILEKIIAESIGQKGVFRVLVIEVKDVERVIAHPSVQGVTLTGSEKAGSSVAALAGKYIKKTVLELGGSDAFIVLDDADVQSAAEAFVLSRMNNTGQTCIAAKRAIVAMKIKSDFVDAVSALIRNIEMGDPMAGKNDIACLARPDLADALQSQLKSMSGLSNILVEGGREEGTNFFRPAFLEPNDNSAAIWGEEIFGPIAIVRQFNGLPEAIKLANQTDYGLGCSIWSVDEARAIDLANHIDAGSMHINRFVSSDPRVPFGGVKRSGYGREMGREGILEFSNLKTITTDRDTRA